MFIVVAQERPVILRERAAGLYRLSAYWMAKQTSELPLTFVMPIIFVSIFYWAVGLNYEVWAFFAYLTLHMNFVFAIQVTILSFHIYILMWILPC